MKLTEDKNYFVEPTQKEIKVLAKKLQVSIAQILIKYQDECRFSQRMAAEVIGIHRKNISKYENGDDLRVSTLCTIIATYQLFMKNNRIEKSEEMEILMRYFFEL